MVGGIYSMNLRAALRVIKYIAASIVLALTLTVTSCSVYQPTYKGVIGNLCERTDENPYGYCYDDLPTGGFPFIMLKDNGGVSVVGDLSILEDHINWTHVYLNLAFYWLSLIHI